MLVIQMSQILMAELEINSLGKITSTGKTHYPHYKADAIADINAITFQTGAYDFTVFGDKRESPVRFDPSYLIQLHSTNLWVSGTWCEDHSSNTNDPQYEYNILTRLHETFGSDISGQDKTNDSLGLKESRMREIKKIVSIVYVMLFLSICRQFVILSMVSLSRFVGGRD